METTIALKVIVQRQSGAFRSSEGIAEEIAGLLEGEVLDIEGSQYEITSVTKE